MKNNTAYLMVAVAAVVVMMVGTRIDLPERTAQGQSQETPNFEQMVLPAEGVVLPIKWGNLWKELVDAGVIDEQKFKAVRPILLGNADENITISLDNSGFLLNMLWAFGLGNKNPILEQGPMVKYNGDAGVFTSTGGWTLAKGNAMDHYSKHQFVALAPEQQALMERVSKNIYRPCCNNSTYFPDCNHGMAMLGLLELMASEGVGEQEMYKIALQVNAYWFPDTYLAIAQYLNSKGSSWGKADPKELLGSNFSSASGYQRILSEITPPEQRGSGSCGI